MDTIYALASGPGKAGVAVIRVSGPDAHDAVMRLAGFVPPMRHMQLARLRDRSGGVLDQALVVLFPEGGSFTGEPVAEFHVHGSPAVVSAVQRELQDRGLARLAVPGEFTRRAMANGQLDLTEVEALGDLIQAETEAQRKQALAALSGALGRVVSEWRAQLIHAMALIAAVIDFSDEDIPDGLLDSICDCLAPVRAGLQKELSGITAAERIRDGFTVAILGLPNVGKSTLLNRLAGREAALTSEIAGTTRDVIEVRMDIGGLPVTLLDTAGIRQTSDSVEQMGVDRARQRAVSADLRIFLYDDRGLPEGVPPQKNDIVLRSKCDEDPDDTGISGLTGAGVDRLLDRVMAELTLQAAQVGSASHHRHRVAMDRALSALEIALDTLRYGNDRIEFVSEDLRSCVQALDELVGSVDVEDVLDEIFRSFCLGK